MRWMTGCLALTLAAAPLSGQDRGVPDAQLPQAAADAVIEFFNDPSTIRFQGRAQVPAGSAIRGNVAVLGGPLQVAGEIQGNVVVVNGNLVLVEAGRITGDVTVVGGEVVGPAESVLGEVTTFSRKLAYHREGDRIALSEQSFSRWNDRRRNSTSYLSIRMDGSYNRVEGLPLMFGPVFRTRKDKYFRADAMAIWKSESGLSLSPEELGYFFRAEQHFGAGGRFAAGGTAHSFVQPIEDSGIQDIETSLTTFLSHRDLRDYYTREGFSAYLRYDDPNAGVRAGLEYRDEEHGFAAVGSPWTIRQNDAPWRPQPLVGEGRARTMATELVLDKRNDPDDPTDGWYLEAHTTAGLGGQLTVPEYFDPESDPPTVAGAARPLDRYFHAGSLDLRRHLRLGPGTDVRLRGFLGGSLNGGVLPPQYQHALGGEGSIPGFPRMALDCGARTRSYSIFPGDVEGGDGGTPTFAQYGCDRVAMFQAQYRGSFPFDFGPNSGIGDSNWYPAINLSPSWAVFFDAGRGWSNSDAGSPVPLGSDSDVLTDVGIGFLLGRFGVYWAWPLTGPDRDVNLFLRLDHRF